MVPSKHASRNDYYRAIAAELKIREVGLVVLAGFMRIVGEPLIEAFRNRIMNIHPALLPSFPGLHGRSRRLTMG